MFNTVQIFHSQFNGNRRATTTPRPKAKPQKPTEKTNAVEQEMDKLIQQARQLRLPSTTRKLNPTTAISSAIAKKSTAKDKNNKKVEVVGKKSTESVVEHVEAEEEQEPYEFVSYITMAM